MIFFIHIPKTAGTTFYDVVKNNFDSFLKPKIEKFGGNSIKIPEGNSISIRLPGGYKSAPTILNEIANRDDLINKNIDFIGGHVGYGFHDIINTKITYISFIRNPKDRIVSDYFEQCKKGKHYYKLLESKNFNINYYLETLLKDKLDNIMTRQLAGPYDFYLNKRGTLSELNLKEAIKNSNNITFFDMDNFDGALKYISKEFGWSKLSYIKKNISNKKNADLSIDKSLMNEVIKYDLLLYDNINSVNRSKMPKYEKLLFKLKSKF